MRTTTRSLTVAAVVALSLVTAACSSSDSMGETSPNAGSPTSVSPAADLVGRGCVAYAEQVPDGPGSLDGMAQDPVATAVGNNPLLTTLTSALGGGLNPDVDLVDTLDGGEYTVFAPVDDAFGKLPADVMRAASQEVGGGTLSGILTYHVIPGRLAPADIDGTFTTVNGAELTITGSGDDIRVGDQASVICGGIQTANATVYLIDTVMRPPAA